MTLERKPFEVQTDDPCPLRMRCTPEADTDMWVVTLFAPNLNGKLELPVFDKLTPNVLVERDYNYFRTHRRDYDVSVLEGEQ